MNSAELVLLEQRTAELLVANQRLQQEMAERALVEARVARLSRFYAALSQCNQAIVRCTSEAELFPQLCQIAVTFGGMTMAWIGLVDAADQIVMAASFGDVNNYLAELDLSVDASKPSGQGITGTAIREDRPYWCQDFASDPRTAPWHERGAKAGWKSVATLPLHRGGKVVGAFLLYACEINAFDTQVQALLVEMASDISFGMDSFAREAARQAAEEALRQSTQRLEIAQNYAHIGYWELWRDGKTAIWSPQIYCMFGLPAEFQPGPDKLCEIVHADDCPAVLASLQHSLATGAEHHVEYRIRRVDNGVLRWIDCHGKPVLGADGRPDKLTGFVQDITERKANEEHLDLLARRAQALLALPQAADVMDELAFMQHALGLAEQLTGSSISCAQFIQDDQETLDSLIWSVGTLEHYCHVATAPHSSISEAGIWADALRQRKPVVVNDYASAPGKRGLPEGHAHLQRLISVPVIDGGLVRMLVGVGNKAQDYTERDMETVRLISDNVWHLVHKRRAVGELRASETRYRTITDTARDGVVTIDSESLIVACNPAVTQLFGYTQEELSGQSLTLLMPQRYRQRHLEGMQKRAADSAPALAGNFVEVHGLHKDGSEFPIELSVAQWSSGRDLFFTGFIRDISTRKHSESQLRKLSLAVEQSPESIVITNLQARIEYVNQAFLSATGYIAEDVLGQNPRFLQSGKTPDETYLQMWAALNAGQSWKGEFINRRKDGSEYVEFAHIAPLRQSDGSVSHYVAVKEDITERKRTGLELDAHRLHLQELVTERTSELEQARKQAESANLAKSMFLANMSHEIRTPMNAIMGLTHLLQHSSVNPQQAQRLAKIDAASTHLLSIINDILDLSKIEASRLHIEHTDFHLSGVLDAVCSIIAESAQAKGLSVQLDTDAVPPWLHGDPTRLRQALLNYAGNAVKFTERGSIAVRARLIEDRSKTCCCALRCKTAALALPPSRSAACFTPSNKPMPRPHASTAAPAWAW